MSAFVPTPGAPIPLSSRRRWLAIVGSVGQPRDRRTAASYALYDDERREITFFRVPYDARTAADKIRRAGCPARSRIASSSASDPPSPCSPIHEDHRAIRVLGVARVRAAVHRVRGLRLLQHRCVDVGGRCARPGAATPWFWMFLGGVGIVFAIISWLMLRGTFGALDE
jgi:diadenosine tetraphosphatase ApaH/serine/threonine PP2A family protein phosphatase